MPSEWSDAAALGDAPDSTSFRTTGLDARSVIRLSLLPLAALQSEPRDHDRGEQERDHRARDRRALAELAGDDRALIRQRRHQVRGVDRSAARHRPDELEIREGE